MNRPTLTLPRRVRRADAPAFDNTRRNVPAMRPGWVVVALLADGSTAEVAGPGLSHVDAANVAHARASHPSAGTTRFVGMLAAAVGR